MIPGLPQDLLQGSDEEGALRMKRMIYITDSMSSAELDSDGSLFLESAKDGKPIGLTWRVARVAQGSGTTVREVEEVLCQYRMMANMAKQAGGKNGWLQTMQKVQNATGGRGRGAGGMPTPAQIQAMQVRALMKDTIPLLRKILTPVFLLLFYFSEFAPAWHAPTDATTNEEWRRNSRNDENPNAKSRWRPSGPRRNATHDEPGRWFRGSRGIGWRHAKYERHVQIDGKGKGRTKVESYATLHTMPVTRYATISPPHEKVASYCIIIP